MNNENPIDTWTSRAFRRIGYEGQGNDSPWRILPESEAPTSNLDTAFKSLAVEHAANLLGSKPEALKYEIAANEQSHWEARGWAEKTTGNEGSSGVQFPSKS